MVIKMKSIKMMLLGIAFLIIGLCGAVLSSTANSMIPIIMFYIGIIGGTLFCLLGFKMKEE